MERRLRDFWCQLFAPAQIVAGSWIGRAFDPKNLLRLKRMMLTLSEQTRQHPAAGRSVCRILFSKVLSFRGLSSKAFRGETDKGQWESLGWISKTTKSTLFIPFERCKQTMSLPWKLWPAKDQKQVVLPRASSRYSGGQAQCFTEVDDETLVEALLSARSLASAV